MCQITIGNLIAEAADHGGNLRIKKGLRNEFGEVPNDFKVLTGGVKHFHHRFISHQREQRAKVNAFGQRINRHRFHRTGNLDDT